MEDEQEEPKRAGPVITLDGYRKLAAELDHLQRVERPSVVRAVSDAAAMGDRSENAEYIYGKRKLREIDRRVQFLIKRLDDVVVVDPGDQRGDRVFFGAWVEVEDEGGARKTYQIVGEDETDADSCRISWRSPLGLAVLKKKVGDSFVVRRPAGEVELVVVSVEYRAERSA